MNEGFQVSRRQFVAGALSAAGACALPETTWAEGGAPLLKLGVVSDIHIGGRKQAPQLLEKALRWLSDRGVEAVLSPGDIAHSGYIREMEQFASVWYRVFPDGRGADGRKVELMISTGNHDAAASWVKGDDAWRTQHVLAHRDNFVRVWDRLFHERFEPIWRREVKGLTFIGAQWPSLKPDLEGYMKAHASSFDPHLPFFHCQHEQPLGTCHGAYGNGYDRGQSVRALSPFPNAVAFSGHSHCSIADERTVWQGAFTSIGAGCLHEGGIAFGYDNGSAFWHPSYKKNFMMPLNDPAAWGGDCEGGCFEFVEVFADHLVVHRRSTTFDLPIGPDWIVPIPAKKGGPFDFVRRAAERAAPEFASDAAVTAKICPKGHALEGPSFKGAPCVYVTFPCAKPVKGARVFEYEVTAKADGKEIKKLRLFAAGFSLPEAKADRPGECLFPLKDLPADKDVVFSVVPRECFGRAGKAIVSAPLFAAARSF